MLKDVSRNVKLGLFVISGTVFFVLVMYMIGNKRNLFNSTIQVSATFYDAEGLMSGNSVRFAGINIGTVESVEIINDSSVKVLMVIQDEVLDHIKKNAIASIGTDGLMGNKIVNIVSATGASKPIEDGDELRTFRSLSTSNMLHTLSVTNENVKEITDDLKLILKKLTNNNSLWSFLSDSTVSDNLKQAIVSIKITGERTALVAGDLSQLMNGIKMGKGTLGALMVDTSLSQKLHQSVVNIELISNDLAIVSGDLKQITTGVKKGDGAVGTLLMDTNFVHNMNQSMENINTGSKGFADNMEALKHSAFLKKYFKEEEKKSGKKK